MPRGIEFTVISKSDHRMGVSVNERESVKMNMSAKLYTVDK
jgi:hypothetical protein